MSDLFKILSVTESMILSPAGVFNPAFDIKFQTKHGVTSSIKILKDAFSPQEVKLQVENEAKKIEEVFLL